MVTRVLLPSHVSSLDRLRDAVKTRLVAVFPIDQSRFIWREIWPCVFAAPSNNVARRMLACLENFLWRAQRIYTLDVDLFPCPSLAEMLSEEETTTLTVRFHERKVPLRRRQRFLNPQYTILILPLIFVKLEYAWEERLIRLEHDLIRAQSVAGLYSTLGGGYFMTRRLQTANALAREQKRIALMLGNKEMYYKCTINQAYNEIYGGHFKLARLHILQVWVALAHEEHFDEKIVLQNMCKSAMLFRKRVRNARREVPEGACRLVDDFSRIRVVDDQSSHDDLKGAPMVRAKM